MKSVPNARSVDLEAWSWCYAKFAAPAPITMRRFGLAIVMYMAAGGAAHADEVWRCAYTNTLTNEPTLVQYHAEARDLIETSGSTAVKHFKIIQDNRYGVIAISAIAGPSLNVSATTVTIEKLTGDFWLTTTIAGQEDSLNPSFHGSCFKP